MHWEYREKNVPRAQQLRKEMTPHERKLWYCFLQTYPIKILRQRPIENYIVDFYCAPAKLVIELDGSQHYDPIGTAYDKERDATLTALGVAVIRFSNNDIDQNFDAVKAEIEQAVNARIEG